MARWIVALALMGVVWAIAPAVSVMSSRSALRAALLEEREAANTELEALSADAQKALNRVSKRMAGLPKDEEHQALRNDIDDLLTAFNKKLNSPTTQGITQDGCFNMIRLVQQYQGWANLLISVFLIVIVMLFDAGVWQQIRYGSFRRFTEFIACAKLGIDFSKMSAVDRGKFIQALGIVRWHAERILEDLSRLASVPQHGNAALGLIVKALQKCCVALDIRSIRAVAPVDAQAGELAKREEELEATISTRVQEQLGQWHEEEEAAAKCTKDSAQSSDKATFLRERERQLSDDFLALNQLESELCSRAAQAPAAGAVSVT